MSNQVIQQVDLFFLIWAFISLGLFLTSWTCERRRLVNGILFNMCLVSFLVPLGLFVLRISSDRPRLTAVITIIFALLFLAVLLLFLSMVFLLLWNAKIVWQREAHTLANSLTLILALGIIALWIINFLPSQHFLPSWLNYLIAILPVIILYLLGSFYNYLTNLGLYQLNRPAYRQNYIIVLGAGLLQGDQVSPLLAQRIQRGIAFYQKQIKKNNQPPTLIFSGGQGADETIPEGAAMAKYAIEQGVNPERVLAEVESKTTFENMKYSKALIQKDAEGTLQDQHIIFVTNNYHTFRAGIYARLAGLKANGIGSKTSKYFLPNAIIREYLAIFMMKKKQHLIVIGSIVILDILTLLLSKL